LAGFQVTLIGRFWVTAEDGHTNEKGRGGMPRPFLIYNSIVSIPTYPPRQLFQLYCPSSCIDLRGKPSKRGLDKISKNREMDRSAKGGLKAGGWRGLSGSSGLLRRLARAELGPGTLKSRGGAYMPTHSQRMRMNGVPAPPAEVAVVVYRWLLAIKS